MDITLSLTHDCNLGCSYCYAGKKSKKAMTWDIASSALDFAFSFSAKTAQIGFFGGEPLMEWDLLKRSTEKAETLAKEKNIVLQKTITTNGSLLNSEKAQWLKKKNFFPAISIDGNRSMHDITRKYRNKKSSFNACIKGLDEIQKVFENYEVILVIDPSNIMHLADSVKYLSEEKNVFRIAINPNFYTEWSEKALATWKEEFIKVGDFILNSYRKEKAVAVNFFENKVITRLKDGFENCDRCNFGEKEISVAPSGNLYPCERLVGDDTNNEMCIGDIKNGFDKEKRKAILDKRGNVNKECLTCSIKNRCMNWCCCINYATTGQINMVDGLVCFHEQTAVEVTDNIAEILFKEKNKIFISRFY